jgi:hypothetical protein
MKKFLPFLFIALLQFTDMAGRPVYIAPSQVADVSLSYNSKQPNATQIRTSGGMYLVQEDPAAVAKAIRDAK